MVTSTYNYQSPVGHWQASLVDFSLRGNDQLQDVNQSSKVTRALTNIVASAAFQKASDQHFRQVGTLSPMTLEVLFNPKDEVEISQLLQDGTKRKITLDHTDPNYETLKEAASTVNTFAKETLAPDEGFFDASALTAKERVRSQTNEYVSTLSESRPVSQKGITYEKNTCWVAASSMLFRNIPSLRKVVEGFSDEKAKKALLDSSKGSEIFTATKQGHSPGMKLGEGNDPNEFYACLIDKGKFVSSDSEDSFDMPDGTRTRTYQLDTSSISGATEAEKREIALLANEIDESEMEGEKYSSRVEVKRPIIQLSANSQEEEIHFKDLLKQEISVQDTRYENIQLVDGSNIFTQTEESFTYSRAPKQLFIQYKRFQRNGSSSAKDSRSLLGVPFVLNLDEVNAIADGAEKQPLYLKGFTVHEGSGQGSVGGHYTSYYLSEGKWYHANGSYVQEVLKEQVLLASQNATDLYYDDEKPTAEDEGVYEQGALARAEEKLHGYIKDQEEVLSWNQLKYQAKEGHLSVSKIDEHLNDLNFRKWQYENQKGAFLETLSTEDSQVEISKQKQELLKIIESLPDKQQEKFLSQLGSRIYHHTDQWKYSDMLKPEYIQIAKDVISNESRFNATISIFLDEAISLFRHYKLSLIQPEKAIHPPKIPEPEDEFFDSFSILNAPFVDEITGFYGSEEMNLGDAIGTLNYDDFYDRISNDTIGWASRTLFENTPLRFNHTYFPLMYPVDELTQKFPNAPFFTKEQLVEFRKAHKEQVLNLTRELIQCFGFEYQKGSYFSPESYKLFANFPKVKDVYWLKAKEQEESFNRIERMMHSLRLLGLDDEAVMIYNAILKVHEKAKQEGESEACQNLERLLARGMKILKMRSSILTPLEGNQ